MSVLVKGMQMPNNCRNCPMEVAGWCFALLPKSEDEEDFAEEVDTEAEGRPSWCPLVEVPTPHGRLADADALDEKVYKHYKTLKISRYDKDLVLHYTDVSMAPTVIEAEE